MQVVLNIFPLRTLVGQVTLYRLESTDPETRNRQVRYRLAANIAKRLAKERGTVFSVGEEIHSISSIPTEHEEQLDIAGTSVLFKVKLTEKEKVDLSDIAQGPERLVNKLVDWYYRERVPSSFHMENANYVGDNLFAKLESKYYKHFKINVNEGLLRATRVLNRTPYLILDTEYRETWQESLWDAVKNYAQNVLSKNVYMPDASTIKGLNEQFGRVGHKPGRRVQGKHGVGEYEVIKFDFSKNPQTPGTAGDLSQSEYFAKVYNDPDAIKDKKQPLVKVRVARGYHYGKENYHVPELLEFDGMPPHIRNNEKLMSALANITRPTPRGRFSPVMSFVQGDPFGKTPGFADDEFIKQFVQVSKSPFSCKAEVLPAFRVRMGGHSFKVSSHQDFLGKIFKNKFHRSPDVKHVTLLHATQREKDVSDFYSQLQDVCNSYGMLLPDASTALVPADEVEAFVRATQKLPDTDIVLSFTPFGGDRIYGSLKHQLLVKRGILSQNISYEKTVDRVKALAERKNEHGVRTILTMVAMQICAKLGGAPWAFTDPIYEEKTPILGLDIYHSREADDAVTGAAAVFDPYGEYLFSHVTEPQAIQEKITTLRNLISGAVGKYVDRFGTPARILIVRDGLNYTQEQAFLRDPHHGELAIIQDTLATQGIYEYVLVMEKTNTHLRMYKKISEYRVDNPEPGTVVVGSPFEDSEMLMVSQDTYHGTCEPVLYRVLKPASPNMPKVAEALHKLCRHHWNTPASIRIPSPAYHADQIVYLMRTVLGGSAINPRILDRPFYL